MPLIAGFGVLIHTKSRRTNERINCRSVAITLDCFENSVIDFICEKGLYINVFPTEKEPLCKIVSLNRFAEDLSVFLEDY